MKAVFQSFSWNWHVGVIGTKSVDSAKLAAFWVTALGAMYNYSQNVRKSRWQ